MSDPVYDVVIVGSGATGAWAAKQLAEAGLQVLVLEAGPQRPVEHSAEPSSRDRASHVEAAKRQPVQSRHPRYWDQNPELYVDDVDHPYTEADGPFVWIRGRQVGGRTLTWGAVTLRFSDFELRAADLDGFGPNWPLHYGDLAPYYDEVERFLGVQGTVEGLAQLPDGIFRAPAAFTQAERAFQISIESRWRDRRAIHCRGIGDPLEASRSSGQWHPKTVQHSVLPAALRTQRVRLRPDSIVSHLVPRADGTAIGAVACIDRKTGETFEVHGRVVVMAASTIETLRILLNSKCERHPAGIGNSSGLLGRYLLDHASVLMAGSIPGCAPIHESPSGGAHGVTVPRFRNLREENRGFIRGYGIWGNMQRGAWGQLDEALWMMSALLEVLPSEANRVELDSARTDAWGISTPRIHFRYGENEQRMADDARSCMKDIAEGLGWRVRWEKTGAPGSFVHELGGARMGTDPASSVLSPYNRCWDVRNLFVADGACFVSSGWQNPTLTMMALAVRACAHIVEEMARGHI